MNKTLFYVAVTGWSLALLVHLLSLADVDVRDTVPFVWVLHLGIFVVWLPAVLALKKNEELKAYKQSGFANTLNPFGFFNIIFKQTPNWMKVIAIVGFYYAVVNFMLSMSSASGTPILRDGQYLLENHGQFIRTLTEQEYNHIKANHVRGFSGHWICFYGIAAAILFPFAQRSTNE